MATLHARAEANKEGIAELGGMAVLTARTLRSALSTPFDYGHELVSQINFAVRMAWLPMILTSFALGFGPAGVQAGGFLKLFGALDRLGGLFVLAVIREIGPLVCGVVIAGVVGTSMCADLGARRLREELDALTVLGVDPIKNLVAPRFLAIVVVTTLFDIYALVFGTAAGIVVTLINHASLGPFFATFFNNASTTEFAASLLKTACFGAVVGIVCCYKGLNATGGPEGVGRRVNEAIVVSFLGIGAVNYVFTQVLLATHPALTVPR